jgi:hypothetical protein
MSLLSLSALTVLISNSLSLLTEGKSQEELSTLSLTKLEDCQKNSFARLSRTPSLSQTTESGFSENQEQNSYALPVEDVLVFKLMICGHVVRAREAHNPQI